MSILFKSAAVDILYRVTFAELSIQDLKEDLRIDLLENLANKFKLRLNDIKINSDSPSDRFISFSKFDDPSFFDVSYGIEEIAAILRRVKSRKQIENLFGDLAFSFKNKPMSLQKWIVDRQLTTETDVKEFLGTFNPSCPHNFQKILEGKGVQFFIKRKEHNLTSNITIADSTYYPGGIYLSIDSTFFPNKYSFAEAFDIFVNHDNFIIDSLNMVIEEQS
jgi:hypothetical protein